MPDLIHTLIFVTVWPEPQSSAAGVRVVQWIQFLLDQGHQLTVISSAGEKSEFDWGFLNPVEHPWRQRVSFLHLPLNRSENAQILKDLNPQFVLFDRFILEEQYGHWIYEHCPHAVVWLETQDLHFLRKFRETHHGNLNSQTLRLEAGVAYTTALRELAAIRRVDRTFVVSSYEQQLLVEQFGVSVDEVHWLPFTYDPPLQPSRFASAREQYLNSVGFCWIGNFRHPPNPDGLFWFLKEGWPNVRKVLPNVRLSIFGAYPSAEVMALHSPNAGIEVRGSAESLDQVFRPKDREPPRVNLAPLRFGAGIKGKILEGFRFGVPAVSTSIGWEGLFPDSFRSPRAAETIEDFVSAAIDLHEKFDQWIVAQQQGFDLLEKVHSYTVQKESWARLLHHDFGLKQEMKLPRWWSDVARRESIKGSRYFSKWIELKERIKSDSI